MFVQIDYIAASMPYGVDNGAVDRLWSTQGWMAARGATKGLLCSYIAWTYCSLAARTPELARHLATRAHDYYYHCRGPAPEPPLPDDVVRR